MIGNFLKGLLFGSIAGGLGGLLFAPKSGNETREELIRYLDDTTEATLEFNDSVKQLKDAVMVTRKTIDETIPVVTESFTKIWKPSNSSTTAPCSDKNPNGTIESAHHDDSSPKRRGRQTNRKFVVFMNFV